MQGDAGKAMKNIALFAGSPPAPMPGVGGVDKYTGKQFEYFESPTREFIWENAKYSSNYFKAQVQGIIPGTFDTERGAYIRSMDIVEQTTGAKMPNDYQTIYFQDTRIKGLYTGAKVKYAGNTWLAISPFNIADPMSSAVVRRCNAIWKHLDFYGNVKAEPFVFQDGRDQSTANEYLDWTVIPNWYQKCVIQLNEDTKQLAYNKRMILGSAAVEVRGISDFITDFSGTDAEGNANAEPPHAMFFDVQFQQPLEIDDMERGIAGGKAFSWVLVPSFSEEIGVSASQTITVKSVRNGEEVTDTAEHPITYLFSSSDETVLTVDADGTVTSVGEGTATVTVALSQNPDITAEVEITVTAEAPQAQFVFTPELPTKLRQMQSYSGVVSVMRGGNAVSTPIVMTMYGSTGSVDCTFDVVTNMLEITNYEASKTPLSLVFRSEEQDLTITKTIKLEGF